MSSEQNRASLPVAAILLFVAIILAFIRNRPNETETKAKGDSAEVYVLSASVGGKPFLLLSNYPAKRRNDGIIEVSTESKKDIQ